MTTLTINIEVSPGASIEDSFAEAIRVAGILNCVIRFAFNGVICFGQPGGSITVGVMNYHVAIKKEVLSKYANSLIKNG